MNETLKKSKVKLYYDLVPLEEITILQKTRMYHLLVSNYDHTNEALFLSDLSNKNFVLLIKDDKHQIQGFSTISINPKQSGGDQYNILFSGDTIIDPNHWGTQELVKGFTYTVGRLLAHDPTKELYWFLMSKGHRTYMYLPLFFNDYYPTIKAPNSELKIILNDVALKLFDKDWKPDLDLIIFDDHHGELKEEHIKDTYLKKKNKHIAFFLEKNPRFHLGEELACLAPLSFENMHPRLHENMKKGFDLGINNLNKR